MIICYLSFTHTDSDRFVSKKKRQKKKERKKSHSIKLISFHNGREKWLKKGMNEFLYVSFENEMKLLVKNFLM